MEDEEYDDYRQKVLVLSTRGITSRMRHLMGDLVALLPHAKKDAKLDTKQRLYMLNELAELSSCNNILFFEARRNDDLYLWAAKAPNGPSIRFQLLNAHTMDELKMTGNCLKGSRPVVVFDPSFDAEPHARIMKELLTHIFAVPKSARRAKPFVDHVMSFSFTDGKVWCRNFQIIADDDGETSLSEIGPRFVLAPVKIFEGSFCGATVFENPEWVSPTANIAARKNERAMAHQTKKEDQVASDARRKMVHRTRPENKLSGQRVFA